MSLTGENVTAVVVTYNRKEILCECLEALLAQTVVPGCILVVNNASTDGTDRLFAGDGPFAGRQEIELVTLPENIGGAGGFCEGIRRAESAGCDWIWIMDDDTIPHPDALEGLLKSGRALKKEDVVPSFLASTVFGPSGEPMNVPLVDRRKAANGYEDWYRYLSVGCVAIQQATFVSLLISSEAVRKAGLPIAEYFIWGDDTEYTRRLVRNAGPAYLCGESQVLHKRFNVRKISIFMENDEKRVRLYYYYFRNALLNAAKYEGKLRTAARFFGYLGMSFSCFFRRGQSCRVRKFVVIQKGCFAFLFHRI